MFRSWRERKQRAFREKLDSEARKLSGDQGVLSGNLEQDMQTFQTLFTGDDTFIIRKLQNVHDERVHGYALYCGGMIDNLLVNRAVIEPFIHVKPKPGGDLADMVLTELLGAHNPAPMDKISEIVESITNGDTVLLLPGSKQALTMGTQGFSLRSIAEPDGEKVIAGPREGFNESIIGNLAMLHRKLRTNDLKIERQTCGRVSRTSIALCYLDSIVHRGALAEMKSRLERIDIDAVIDANYISELIRDKRRSPFRSIGATERPDVVAAKLLEGRVALFVDGSPSVLTAPYLFIENFQANEDYYLNYYFASFSRLLRIVGMVLAMFTTGLYICITSFHYEILPTSLLLNITSETQNVPFPLVVEAFLMLIVFDILRETGVRMPTNGGQALSIVGALVIGQSAVEARLASPQMIIVIAITGIANLLIPKLNAASIVVRPLVLTAAGCFGLLGLTLAAAALLVHILNLTSLGMPQTGLSPSDAKHPAQDVILRRPWWEITKRPAGLSRNRVRQIAADTEEEAFYES